MELPPDPASPVRPAAKRALSSSALASPQKAARFDAVAAHAGSPHGSPARAVQAAEGSPPGALPGLGDAWAARPPLAPLAPFPPTTPARPPPPRRSDSSYSIAQPDTPADGRLTPLVKLFGPDYFGTLPPLRRTLADSDLGVENDEHVGTGNTRPPADPAHLPTEVLQRIFAFLSPASTPGTPPPPRAALYAAARVCREWYYAAVQMLWRAPAWHSIHSFERWLAACRLPAAGDGAPRPGCTGRQLVRRIEAGRTPYLVQYVRPEAVEELAGRFGGITHLDLAGCAAMTDDAVSNFVSATPRHLISIDLSNCFRISDVAVQVIATFCGPWNRLRRLLLRNCGQVSDASLNQIAAHLLPSLRTLDVSGCRRISDHGLLQFARRLAAAAPQGAGLSRFGISGCWRLTRTGYLQILPTLFAANPRLASFESSLPLHPLVSADQVFGNLPVGLFSGLTRLALREAEKCIDDAVLLSISAACGAGLRSLELHGASLVTEPGFARAADSLLSLRRLALPQAKGLGDAALLRVATHPRLSEDLEELDASGWGITDAGIVAALENPGRGRPLPNLAVLRLADCSESSFTFHGIFSAARALVGRPARAKLRALDVSGCIDLDGADGHLHFPWIAAGVPAGLPAPAPAQQAGWQGVQGIAATVQAALAGALGVQQHPEAGAGYEIDATPVDDAFVVSLLTVPERPTGSAKIGGPGRWYCVLAGEALERVAREGMRRVRPRAERVGEAVDPAVGVAMNAAAG
ncbi:hypothetical protein DFJ74DRAFT_765960 [Hyaloraphidium curvatum]|nr:hypothetical protein DFJ74DRAFT_765960 [Hyaloraphidium curvatum]